MNDFIYMIKDQQRSPENEDATEEFVRDDFAPPESKPIARTPSKPDYLDYIISFALLATLTGVLVAIGYVLFRSLR